MVLNLPIRINGVPIEQIMEDNPEIAEQRAVLILEDLINERFRLRPDQTIEVIEPPQRPRRRRRPSRRRRNRRNLTPSPPPSPPPVREDQLIRLPEDPEDREQFVQLLLERDSLRQRRRILRRAARLEANHALVNASVVPTGEKEEKKDEEKDNVVPKENEESSGEEYGFMEAKLTFPHN